MRTWVLIYFNDGHIQVWRDYGDIVWGSTPVYTVLGYFVGTFPQAHDMARELVKGGPQ